MRISPIGSNQTEWEHDGCTVLFSYQTPVACHIPGLGFARTKEKHSATTSKHINKWLDGANAVEKPQKFFDQLVNQI